MRCDSVPQKTASAARTTIEETMRLALYEPDIPQNLGAFIRLAAGTGVALDIIEPCGFPVDDKRIRRAAMDYYNLATLARHASWASFCRARSSGRPPGRLILLTTVGETVFPKVLFQTNDTLLVGRESAGVPQDVHDAADLRLRIPMQPGARSLNVALAATMVLSEALRQTNGFDSLA
jgi:tRNA (cytidine/uridine-2'-O-)-methyltransferase